MWLKINFTPDQFGPPSSRRTDRKPATKDIIVLWCISSRSPRIVFHMWFCWEGDYYMPGGIVQDVSHGMNKKGMEIEYSIIIKHSSLRLPVKWNADHKSNGRRWKLREKATPREPVNRFIVYLCIHWKSEKSSISVLFHRIISIQLCVKYDSPLYINTKLLSWWEISNNVHFTGLRH